MAKTQTKTAKPAPFTGDWKVDFANPLKLSEVHDVLSENLPDKVPLYREARKGNDEGPTTYEQSPLYEIVSADRRHTVTTVKEGFQMEDADSLCVKIQSIAEVALGGNMARGGRAYYVQLNQYGTRLRLKCRLTRDPIGDSEYTPFATISWNPGLESWRLMMDALRIVCMNGLYRLESFFEARVVNSSQFDWNTASAITRVKDLTESYVEFDKWVRNLERVKLNDNQAVMTLKRILGLDPNADIDNKKFAKDEARFNRLWGSYQGSLVADGYLTQDMDVPGAIPGTLRGVFEAATFYDSHLAPVRVRGGSTTSTEDARMVAQTTNGPTVLTPRAMKVIDQFLMEGRN